MNGWKFLLTWIRCKANVSFSCISAVTPLAVQAFSVKWVYFQGNTIFHRSMFWLGISTDIKAVSLLRLSTSLTFSAQFDPLSVFRRKWLSLFISTVFRFFSWLFNQNRVSELTLNLTWRGNTYCSEFIPKKCIVFLIRPPLSFLITSLVKIWKSLSQSFFDKKLHTSSNSRTRQDFQNVILVPSSLSLWKVCM